MTTSSDFTARTTRYQPELLAHCYRMLGSIHDAEDLVQETMLRAWKAADRFDEERASLRTWLYRIATNVCLTALEQRGRRALPTGLVAPSDEMNLFPQRHPEIPWLEPLPDVLVHNPTADPAVVVAARSGVRLAFVAALQLLPARQRAVLILRDVLAWSAAEVADLLETSPAAVNSALQRAHAHLAAEAPMLDRMSESLSPEERTTIDRYVSAFTNADVDEFTKLLHDDVKLEMPPALFWLAGRTRAIEFIVGKRCADNGTWRTIPTSANTQPAAALYRLDENGIYQGHSIHVLTLQGSAVTQITVFLDATLFPHFALPPNL